MNVLVLCGSQEGKVGEDRFYPVDKEIIASLKKINGLEVTGQIYDEEELKKLSKDDFSVVFNLCDSFIDGRKEGEMVEHLEKKHIPFTGNSSKPLLLCMDKPAVKKLLQSSHVPCPLFFSVSSSSSQLPENIPFPVIVKPAHEHGSVGIDEDAVVFDKDKFQKKVAKIFEDVKQTLIVEQYIDGREYCIPIIGNAHPTVLPILEIDYSQHFEEKAKILSYKAKWSKQSQVFKNTYSRISHMNEELKERLEAIAKKVYVAIGMRGYGTIDVRIDQFGNIYVIDVNMNSYIAPDSDLAKAAAHNGISYLDLLKKIMDFAIHTH